MTSVLDAALQATYRGWRVLPLHKPTAQGCTCRERSACASAGKHPRVNWPDSQVIDEAQVRRWWSRWPTANVGIVTGEASGLLVLDIDPRHDGARSLELLERRYGGLPESLVARTGSLGIHIYLGHPGVRIGPSAGKLGTGLDVRGDRGLIVAPPSLHASGRRYGWLRGDPDHLGPTPEWLLRALLPPPKPVRPLVLSGIGANRYVEVALERAGEKVRNAPDGALHDTLWRQAFALGTLVGAGLVDESTAERVLCGALGSRARSERAAIYTIRRSLARGRQCPRRVAS
jgi:hypothetical protein